MAQYVLHYTVMVGTRLSRRLQEINTPNDLVALQKAARVWKGVKQWAKKGIGPIMVTVMRPRLFRDDEQISATFDNSG